ncbi:uncharacterized protein LOC117100565 [Anneissia japonica]|uniref:uncharacterized protein LOC117100565 n=1 Tax=Anneissia japonica TaxID=1529436 RepID=UPI001425A78B|nr:uncharacterized protein LOC117100565 [Anneissia japonica]
MLIAMASSLKVLAIVGILMMSTSNGQVECEVKPIDKLSSSHFYGRSNTTMMNEMISYQNKSRYECMQMCRQNASCVAFTYAEDSQSCSMFDHDSETGPELLQSGPGVWFYDLRQKDITESYVGMCIEGNRCRNGASCFTDCSNIGYSCICPIQFYGKYCENTFTHTPVLRTRIIGGPSASNIAFSHKKNHYLVIGGYDGVAETTTKVYKYSSISGFYEYLQDLSGTSVALKMEAFEINDKLYLFVANYKQHGGSTITTSYIYTIKSETGLFEQHQAISTQGAYSASYLKLNANHYLLVANYYGSTLDVNSIVYQWNSDSNQFIEFAQLATNGASGCKLFSIDSSLYAVIANFKGSIDGHSVFSKVWTVIKGGFASRVYKGCFVDSGSRALPSIHTSYVSMTVDWCIAYCYDRGHAYAGLQAASYCFCGGDTYSKYGQRPDSECNSNCRGNPLEKCGGGWKNSVYNTGAENSLSETNAGSIGIDVFESDGVTYLVAVNHFECVQNTIVYTFNKYTNEFEIHQRIPLEHCPITVTVFKVGGEIFMVLGTDRKEWSASDVESYTTSSPIFKLEGSMFVKYRTVTSQVSWDFTFFERDGEYFLGQSNQRNENDGSSSDASFNIYQWI